MISQQTKSGFTLIEIIFVVAIISILASIAVPIYQQNIKSAQRSACLSEAKGYSNNVFYVINSQDNGVTPIAPNISACQTITDATGWKLQTQKKIMATAKSPSNARIECDLPNGSPCRVLP